MNKVFYYSLKDQSLVSLWFACDKRSATESPKEFQAEYPSSDLSFVVLFTI